MLLGVGPARSGCAGRSRRGEAGQWRGAAGAARNGCGEEPVWRGPASAVIHQRGATGAARREGERKAVAKSWRTRAYTAVGHAAAGSRPASAACRDSAAALTPIAWPTVAQILRPPAVSRRRMRVALGGGGTPCGTGGRE